MFNLYFDLLQLHISTSCTTARVCQESLTAYIMCILDFPDEVILQILDKLNLFDRINFSMIHTRLSPLCFDRSLQRKSTETLTLNELSQLYEQSKTENEKDQCFKSNILDRLLIKSFYEVVHLYTDPKNKRFVANGKILHSLEGKFRSVTIEDMQMILSYF